MSDEYVKILEKRNAELEQIIESGASRMYVPTIGSVLMLRKDWTFALHHERRNEKFIQKFIDQNYNYWKNYNTYYGKTENITLVKGTKLKVARIYVRSGVGDYDSITFSIVENPANKKLKARFWCKLNDANKIEFTLLDGKGKIGE